jgi:para-nitrobenzyl esterase
VAGESAGANSTLALIASPAAKGLFRGAIVQSGVNDAHVVSRAKAFATGEKLAEDLGCPAGDNQTNQQAACLRALPVAAILKGWRKLPITQDPEIFPIDPYEAFQTGQFNRVPVLAGTNLHEDYLFVSGQEDQLGRKLDASDYTAGLESAFGPLAQTAEALYPLRKSPSPAAALGDAVTDLRFSCYIDMARHDMSAYTSVFGYELVQPDPPQQQPRIARSLANTSYHTTDLGYLFDNANGPLSGKDATLGHQLRAYWINFVRSGNPNASGLPAWPTYSAAKPLIRKLSSAGGISGDFASRHHCEDAQSAGLVTHTWP